ncbi:MAG TPA: phage portal protein [Methylophilaceae bacterium]|nr:phage portal protein [Methylophilaceae bacterium]
MAKTKKVEFKPNLIDKAIAYVSPKAAYRRHQSRMALAMSGGHGGYSGARVDRTALANWRVSSGSAETDINPDLPNLRERSRDLVRNTPIATGAVELATTHVIGTGLSPQPMPDYKFLGLTEEQSSDWIDNTVREFNIFAMSKDASIERDLNFYQLQALVFRSRMESGDVFALTPSIDRAAVYSLCLQVIEADRISNPGRKQNTNNLVDGIEKDPATGASIRCHIANKHPGDYRNASSTTWTAYNFYGTNGRRNVLHIFKKLRPGQVRGVPDFAPIIEPLKQLGRYTDAELQAAVVSGMFAIFMKMDPDGFQEIFDNNAQSALVQKAGEWEGDMDNGGKAVNLLPGEEPVTVNPGRPNSEFDPFVQAIIRQIGMALGIPYEVLIMHYQSSYSAARAAMLNAWRTWRLARDWMATDFCQPVYELWLEEAVARGYIKAPGFFQDKRVRAAWCKAQWIGDGPGSIDPVKEVDAAEKRVELGISTLAAESVLHDGIDWKSKHEQRTKEKKMRDEAGLTSSSKQSAPMISNDATSRIED